MLTRLVAGVMILAGGSMAFGQATHSLTTGDVYGTRFTFDLWGWFAAGDDWNAGDLHIVTDKTVTILDPTNNPMGPWAPTQLGNVPYAGDIDTLVISHANVPTFYPLIVGAGTSYTPTDAIVTWLDPPGTVSPNPRNYLGKIGLNIPGGGPVKIASGNVPGAFAVITMRSVTQLVPDPALNTDVWSVVPEPGALGLLAFGALALIRRR